MIIAVVIGALAVSALLGVVLAIMETAEGNQARRRALHRSFEARTGRDASRIPDPDPPPTRFAK